MTYVGRDRSSAPYFGIIANKLDAVARVDGGGAKVALFEPHGGGGGLVPAVCGGSGFGDGGWRRGVGAVEEETGGTRHVALSMTSFDDVNCAARADLAVQRKIERCGHGPRSKLVAGPGHGPTEAE